MGRKYQIPRPRPSMEERILLALRAGPLTRQQIEDRLGHVCLDTLLHKGMVKSRHISSEEIIGFNAMEYSLTEAGRAACPRWRDLCKPEAGLDGARS